jgi:predicted permease
VPVGANPLVISSTPDWRILAFTAAISTVCGVIFGLIPALQIIRADIAPTLKDQAANIVSGGSLNLRKALIAAQVMLSMVLLIAAGLFIRSLKTLKDLDPGFRTDNVLAFSLDPTRSGYTPERTMAFYRQLKDQLDQIPGVQSSSLAVMRVLDESEWDSWVTVEGYQAGAGEWVDPHMNFVAPGYFDTLGVPLLEGRDFRYTDRKDTGKVAIVNEKFAKRYFQGKSPIGRHIGMGGDPGTKTDIEIIGMVRDTKYENMRAEMPLGVFRPYQQMDFALGMTAYIRTASAPEQMFSTIRQLLNRLDPNLPVYSMRTLQEQMQNSLSTERLVASLTSAFGLVASILAGIGIYGVIAYSVSRRTREIGIRTALGAQRMDVAWLVMREALLIVGFGLLAGLPAAFGLSRLARAQLYGISPGDPTAMLAAAGSILLITLIAVYVPAARASRVDPMQALRWE